MCQRLFESETDCNYRFGCCSRCTPLLYSLHKNELVIAEYLLSRGASIEGRVCDAYDTRGYSVFHYAAAYGTLSLLRSLIDKSLHSFLDKSDAVHPIHLAAASANYECMQTIIQALNDAGEKQDVQTIEAGNLSVRTSASILRNPFRKLLNQPVRREDLDRVWYNPKGQPFPECSAYLMATATPLHIAAALGHPRTVQLLLEAGAAIDGADSAFWTPLHFAASRNNNAIIESLLQSGANANAVDVAMQTPMMVAASRNALSCLQALSKHGADENLLDHYGRSCLRLAASTGAKDALVFLMNKMSSHSLRLLDGYGWSVLMYAIHQAKTVPAAFLLNFAADRSA